MRSKVEYKKTPPDRGTKWFREFVLRTKKQKSIFFWGFVAFTRQPPHPTDKRQSILGHPPCLADAVINYRVSLDRRAFHVCRGRDGHSGRHFRGHPRDFPAHSSNATHHVGGQFRGRLWKECRRQTDDTRGPTPLEWTEVWAGVASHAEKGRGRCGESTQLKSGLHAQASAGGNKLKEIEGPATAARP